MQLDEILKIQDGVISLKQARSCGMTDEAVRYKLATGTWVRQASGIYMSAEHRKTHVTRFRVAMLSVGKDATAHGISAAWWHGLCESAPGRHRITVPVKRSIRRPRLDLRRRDLAEVDIISVRGIAVTGIPLTVIEVGDSVLMDQALQTRTSITELEEAHQRNRDCTGAAHAGRLIEVAKSGGRSEAERLAQRILAPLPGWRAQLKVGGRAVDIGFEAVKVGIEVDGWRWHMDSRRNSLDLQRQNALTLAGWTILRFDWHRLTTDPDGVLAEVTQAVRTRRS